MAMDKNTVQEVDFHDIIEGIRPDAPPDLFRQKEKEAADALRNQENVQRHKKSKPPKSKVRKDDSPDNIPDEECSPEEFFLSHFINTPMMKTLARQGKMVYMRPEYHERIQRIISVIGNNQLNISTYVDNIFAHHFEEFEEPIRKLYNKNYHDVY